MIPRLWTHATKRMVVPKGGEEVWREDQVWEEGDESKVLFCTQLHVLCPLVIYGEFGQANWSADKRSRVEIISPAI